MKNLKYIAGICLLGMMSVACEPGKVPSKPYPKPPRTTTTLSTSTTIPVTTSTSTTTSTSPTTTTTTSTTTTSTTTTSTTSTPPSTTILIVTSCGLVNPVFCETFDVPAGNGGRSGDLDPELWGVSRVAQINPSQGMNNLVAATSMQGCGTTVPALPSRDVRICNGKMFESQNDNHGVVGLATYPKQPFDFAGRTGKVTFDVSADSDGTHGAWPEFWLTDKPVPGVFGSISVPQRTAGRHDFGFALDGCGGFSGTTTGVGGMWASRNYVTAEVPFQSVGCVVKGTLTNLNHFELRISQNRAEVWGTDPGSTVLKQLAIAENINLSFTRGLPWLTDVHYNARKADGSACACGTQWDHTFAWDNLGFDGPATYRDLSFDVKDSNLAAGISGEGREQVNLGYPIGTGITLSTDPVFRRQTPTGAILTFNTYSFDTVVPDISINGGPWITTVWPFDINGYGWRSIDIAVPLSQVTDGVNTISFRSTGSNSLVSNINLILIAGAPVPTSG